MKRYCQTLTLVDNPALIEKYVEAHAHVWPEIIAGQREDFTVVLWRRERVGNDKEDGELNGAVNGDLSGDRGNDSLNDSVNNTYQTIKANPGIRRKRIAELTGKSIPTIDRHLVLLVKFDRIEYRGSDKTGGYYVKK